MSSVKVEIENLFRVYYRPLCLYSLHIIDDIEEVEDIVHDCFIELMNKLQSGHLISNKKSYLYTLVRNHSIAHHKKMQNFKSINDIDVEDEDSYSENRSFIEARLWERIDALPKSCREIFLMSKRDGLKYSEIAEELNISIKTVENQISKAYKKLKEGAIKIYNFLFA